MFVNSVSNMG